MKNKVVSKTLVVMVKYQQVANWNRFEIVMIINGLAAISDKGLFKNYCRETKQSIVKQLMLNKLLCTQLYWTYAYRSLPQANG